MNYIFHDLEYNVGTDLLSSEDIQSLLFLPYQIIESNDNYDHYGIISTRYDMFFRNFDIVYVKNTNFDFRQENRRLFSSLSRTFEGIFDEYYIRENINPEFVIKKLAFEDPATGIPLLNAYSKQLVDDLKIKTNQIKSFTDKISMLFEYLKSNNIEYKKYDFDINKLESLQQKELEEYIDSLKIPDRERFQQYCDLDFLPVIINNSFCIVDYSSRSFYKIDQNDNHFKFYLINLDYPKINVSEDLEDIVSEFLYNSAQGFHLLHDEISNENLILEVVDNKITFLTPSIVNLEIIQDVIFKDVFKKKNKKL